MGNYWWTKFRTVDLSWKFLKSQFNSKYPKGCAQPRLARLPECTCPSVVPCGSVLCGRWPPCAWGGHLSGPREAFECRCWEQLPKGAFLFEISFLLNYYLGAIIGQAIFTPCHLETLLQFCEDWLLLIQNCLEVGTIIFISLDISVMKFSSHANVSSIFIQKANLSRWFV